MDTAQSNPGWIGVVPNVLTVARLGMAVAFLFVPPAWHLALIIAAGLSDWIDGVIARRFNAMSMSGAILDGIADKAFVIAVLVTFASQGVIGWWQVALVLARDIAVALVTLIVVAHREWRAWRHMVSRIPGKLTTAILFVWFGTLLVDAIRPAADPLFWLAALTSVLAAVDYMREGLHRWRGLREAPHST